MLKKALVLKNSAMSYWKRELAKTLSKRSSKKSRDDSEELRKIIARKANRYDDQQKLIQYLVRQGFNYSDVLDELASSSEGA